MKTKASFNEAERQLQKYEIKKLKRETTKTRREPEVPKGKSRQSKSATKPEINKWLIINKPWEHRERELNFTGL